jgi:hypothetical protein
MLNRAFKELSTQRRKVKRKNAKEGHVRGDRRASVHARNFFASFQLFFAPFASNAFVFRSLAKGVKSRG